MSYRQILVGPKVQSSRIWARISLATSLHLGDISGVCPVVILLSSESEIIEEHSFVTVRRQIILQDKNKQHFHMCIKVKWEKVGIYP